MLKIKKLVTSGLFFFLLGGLAFIGGRILAALYTNIGMVTLLKAEACDLNWYRCRGSPSPYPMILSEKNRDSLLGSKNILEKAWRLNPHSTAIPLHLAEIGFSLGNRDTSGALLNLLPEPEQRISPLLIATRYEAQLEFARQAVERKDWFKAIKHFRLGLAWGDERTLLTDEADYFLALVEAEKSTLGEQPYDPQRLYRIGRYYAQAEERNAAFDYLSALLSQGSLEKRQKARVNHLLGQLYEADGETESALTFYAYSIEQDPEFREGYYDLIRCLNQDGKRTEAAQYQEKLSNLGPSYYLGVEGENFQSHLPVAANEEWTLVGYEIDEEILEQAKTLTLLLWWIKKGDSPESGDFIRVGKYWIQRQSVTNLYPNAGYEWGVDEKKLPLGFDREYYGAPKGTFQVVEEERNGRKTQVLIANNGAEVNMSGLITKEFLVKSGSFYLLGGWGENQDQQVNMMINCWQEDQLPSTNYYVSYRTFSRPMGEWIHNADLAVLSHKKDYAKCTVFAINQANLPAQWDNLFVFRISTP